MPWKRTDPMSQRQEFIRFALQSGANIRRLCRQFEISPKTGYKWIARFVEAGVAGLKEHSRRPKRSPNQTAPEIEKIVLEVRDEVPQWGARKIRRVLLNQVGKRVVIPATSTINGILKRNDRISEQESAKRVPHTRFERDHPNELWQMDFKGHFKMTVGRCHPLMVIDDCSRYLLGVFPCGNERADTVQSCLTRVFRKYGLPDRMLMDNGSSWGSRREHTIVTVWLLRLDVGLSHGRTLHPQTQGKCERVNRTFSSECLKSTSFGSLSECDVSFERWRHRYNTIRPHEALGMNVPASRYRSSRREFPEELPPIEYGPGSTVRKVGAGGHVWYGNRRYRVGKAFRGYPVALVPAEHEDGILIVYFCRYRIAQINLRDHNK